MFLNLNFMMENIIEKINKVFLNCEKIYEDNKTANTRNSKILFNNVLEYAFKYSQYGKTKMDIMSTLKIKAHRTSYERKLKNFSVEFFKKLFVNVNELFNDEINANVELKIIAKSLNENFNDLNIQINESDEMINDKCTKYNIIAYDGTTNNRIQNNILNTDQNLFGYNVNYNIPVTLNTNVTSTYNNKNNKSNKNSEITMFIDLVKNNPKICENSVFLGDRLYSVYELFDVINKNKGKYIFRLKENMDILNKNEFENTKKKNNNIKKALMNNKNIKIIEYSEERYKNIVTQTNKTVALKVKSTFYLLTNLGDCENFSDDLIKNMYNSRWNIEVFNKYIKNNFKFEKFYLKNNEEIEKIKYLDLIVSTIIKLLVLMCLQEKNKTNVNLLNGEIKKKFNNNMDKRTTDYKVYLKNFKETAKASVRVNLTLFTTKFYEKIVSELVYGFLKKETMENIIKYDLVIIKNELNRTFERKSVTPFTKWYVKMYHKMYEYKKIFDAIENNSINKLNKNLKCKALVIQKSMRDAGK